MSVELELQLAAGGEGIPPASAFRVWSQAALVDQSDDLELAIRVVDEQEGRSINHEFRGRDYATNVLSFAFEPPEGVPPEAVGNYLGDLVICAPVVEREAKEQGKPLAAHWAHMVVHGVLHLRGYDHETDEEAQRMEAKEREILDGLGISDPYAQA